MLNYLFLFGGMALIIFSANWLVDGASGIAKKFGISDLVIGLTIVAFGTSAPELTVNVFSALQGSTDIAIGNVLGSNIANIFLILGVAALIYPLSIQRNTTWKEIPLSLLAAVVLGVLANDQLIDRSTTGSEVSRIDGIVLLCFFLIFMVYTFEIARSQKEAIDESIKPVPLWKGLLLIAIGLLGLYFGGKYLVEGAIVIAREFGMSERLIGLTIIAIGTSLPELATSVVAAFKKKADIAIGNVVGSNIFNIFFILGVTSVLKPLPFVPAANFDIIATILASLLLFLTTFTLGRKSVDRIEGGFFVLIYIGYIIYSLAMGSTTTA
ncbi:putative transmembrane K+ dependent Na+/Ca+ exchanger-related protein [Flammeovirgaceae bacterium 311]|nr:putative transmembrane K+ dependent Na+/Ca+ exchanger-related protein [Flammeovirgaceae bacterium 311]